MKDMPSTDAPITDEERRKFLNDKLHAIEMAILALPPSYGKKHPERKRLGQQKFFLQCQLSELRKEPKSFPQLGQCFIDAASRLVPPDVYAKIMEEAKHIHEVRYAAERNRAAVQRDLIAQRHLEKVTNDSKGE